MSRLWALLLLILAGLTACGGAASPLELAADKPTFLFFYTDN